MSGSGAAFAAAALALALAATPPAEAAPPLPTAPSAAPGTALRTPPQAVPEAGPQEAGGAQEAVLGADSALALLRRVADRQDAMAARLDSLAGGEAEGAATWFQDLGGKVFWSLVVIVATALFIRSVTWFLDALAERVPARRLLLKRVGPVVRLFLWVVVAYVVIRVIFGLDDEGLVAAAAAVGVAVGFAAQDLLKNLFGGLILVFDQPFQVGDKVSVGGTYGEVTSIGLRSTRLVTADDNLVSVPNAQVVDQQVANANAGQLNCQVVTDLYLPGHVDEARAKAIAREAAATSKYVFLAKPIVVLVNDVFKETFLTRIRVKAYVLDPRYEFLFQSDVTERARAGFRKAGLFTRADGMRAWVALGRQPSDPDEAEEP